MFCGDVVRRGTVVAVEIVKSEEVIRLIVMFAERSSMALAKVRFRHIHEGA
jgi:hypothetical protein